uniref:Uncharacterized protein n=1 Tax=Arundo donax TaxID=35708 RepID=A0A0A9G9I0_ARUDO
MLRVIAIYFSKFFWGFKRSAEPHALRRQI